MGNIKYVKEWLSLAKMDIECAEHLLTMCPLPIEVICYHCQQSAEKYLKGYLVYHGIIPPKIHDLDELCRLCRTVSESFSEIADPCSDLTAYGVQPRYPMGLHLEKCDMYHAIEAAKTIEGFVTNILAVIYLP